MIIATIIASWILLFVACIIIAMIFSWWVIDVMICVSIPMFLYSIGLPDFCYSLLAVFGFCYSFVLMKKQHLFLRKHVKWYDDFWKNLLIKIDSKKSTEPVKIVKQKDLAKQAEIRRKYPTKEEMRIERNKMTPKLRKKILERDNYTCQKCGLSRFDEPNLNLHVDHIIPIAKGGKTVESNLQCLCWKCNLKKGDKIE